MPNFHPDFEHDKPLRDAISAKLTRFDRVTHEDAALTAAAVVIGITSQPGNSAASILLTRRSSKLRKHAGQYALPGGKVDAGESTTDAALRELEEELGLQQTHSSVLGMLDDMPTQSGFNITPVVVWINSGNSLQPNPDEVAAVFHIPLTELEGLTPDEHFEDEQNDSEPTQQVMSLYLPSVGTSVYSPTAAMIYQFREVALSGRATRVAHFGQPRFAWR